MKHCRKGQLFRRHRRRRRRQQQIVLIVLGVLVSSSLGLFLFKQISSSDDVEASPLIDSPLYSSSTSCHCSKSSLVNSNRGECFFDQLVCYPGFDGKNCQTQLTDEKYRSHCPSNIHYTQWNSIIIEQAKSRCSKSQVTLEKWNRSCLFLCFYHQKTGIIQVPPAFWRTALTNELSYWKDNPMTIDDRLFEHVEGFSGYKIIPSELKSIVEIGAGPFTQIQYLLTPFRSIKRITLIEPNALEYMQLNNCAYRGGHLRGFPVSILAESIEVVMNNRRRHRKLHSNSIEYYSAVVSMNVVEHVSDALEYFRGLYDLLEENGWLIFHERWYDNPQQGDCVLDSVEVLHPIRITRWIIDRFLDQFEPIYINFNQTSRQKRSRCLEQGVYFIGRKRSTCG